MANQATVQDKTEKPTSSSHLQATQKTKGEIIQDVDIPNPPPEEAEMETFEAEDIGDEDYDPSKGNEIEGEDDEYSAAVAKVALKGDRMQAVPTPSSSGLGLNRKQKQQKVPLKKKKGTENKVVPKRQKQQRGALQKALRKHQQSQKQQQQKGRRTTFITAKKKNQKRQQKQALPPKKKVKSVKKTVPGMIKNKRKVVASKTNKAKATGKVGKRGSGRK